MDEFNDLKEMMTKLEKEWTSFQNGNQAAGKRARSIIMDMRAVGQKMRELVLAARKK